MKQVSLRIPRYHSTVLTLLLLLICTGLSAGELRQWKDTAQAPSLNAVGLDGQNHDLAEQRGKVVLVNFWATWCAPCVIEMPDLQWLDDQFAASEFHLYAVNMSEPRFNVWRYIQSIQTRFDVLLDEGGQIAADWRAAVLPSSFIIDQQGKIRYFAIGLMDWRDPRILSTIRRLVAEPAS